MNETRRKPTTGTQCYTLFERCHAFVYAQSHKTAAHTKAFDNDTHGDNDSGAQDDNE